jgi:hypothetical protein
MLLGHNRRGFGNLIFPLWFALIGGSFVFLDVSPSNLFLVFPLFFFFWMLWFIYDWHVIIIISIITLDVDESNVVPQKKMIDVPIKCCAPKENELAKFQLWALATKPLKFGATLLHLPHTHYKK